MEEVIFSYGGTKRVITTLRYFKDRPTVAEARVVILQMLYGGNDDVINNKFNAVLVQHLKGSSWHVL